MKNYLIIILALIAGYLFYDKFTTKESTKTVFVKGKEAIKYIRAPIDTAKKINRNRIKIDIVPSPIDTIPKLPVIRSSFVDSTSSYVLNLQAYAIAPVDSFKFNIKTFLDSVKTYHVDTLKTEITIETNTPNWYYVAGSLILGLILGK